MNYQFLKLEELEDGTKNFTLSDVVQAYNTGKSEAAKTAKDLMIEKAREFYFRGMIDLTSDFKKDMLKRLPKQEADLMEKTFNLLREKLMKDNSISIKGSATKCPLCESEDLRISEDGAQIICGYCQFPQEL